MHDMSLLIKMIFCGKKNNLKANIFRFKYRKINLNFKKSSLSLKKMFKNILTFI